MTTSIHFIDFEPKPLESSFWKGAKYESMEVTLKRVNEWIRKNYNRTIINVETVILPNIYKKDVATTVEVQSYYTNGHVVHSFQVIRVWYKD